MNRHQTKVIYRSLVRPLILDVMLIATMSVVSTHLVPRWNGQALTLFMDVCFFAALGFSLMGLHRLWVPGASYDFLSVIDAFSSNGHQTVKGAR